MKDLVRILAFLLLLQCYACDNNKEQLIAIDEVSPWCIIGFDTEERTPEERITMIQELGLKKYGFNRGKGEFDDMITEFNLATEHDIEITSVFLWLNAKRDSLGKLSESNQQIINNLKEVEQKPTIWVSFSDNYFKEKNEAQSIALAVEMINFIKESADEIGCKMALYNHHGWFGNPYNQLNVLKALNQDSISMVYNFHHAHEFVDEFCNIAKLIAPHLSFVNINGVKKDGPQIMTIGEGDYEYEMIRCLKQEGFEGPWGILGHIKTEDANEVLTRNLAGLKLLNKKCLSSDNAH